MLLGFGNVHVHDSCLMKKKGYPKFLNSHFQDFIILEFYDE